VHQLAGVWAVALLAAMSEWKNLSKAASMNKTPGTVVSHTGRFDFRSPHRPGLEA
jgi:hypothetical protein